VKALAFNRHASTEGETKCLNYITKEITKEDIDSEVEHFEWANNLTIVMKLLFILIFGFIVVNQSILLFPIIAWIIFLLDIIFIVCIVNEMKHIFNSTRITYIGKKKEATNVITTVRCKD
jgi:hypothetical protein